MLPSVAIRANLISIRLNRSRPGLAPAPLTTEATAQTLTRRQRCLLILWHDWTAMASKASPARAGFHSATSSTPRPERRRGREPRHGGAPSRRGRHATRSTWTERCSRPRVFESGVWSQASPAETQAGAASPGQAAGGNEPMSSRCWSPGDGQARHGRRARRRAFTAGCSSGTPDHLQGHGEVAGHVTRRPRVGHPRAARRHRGHRALELPLKIAAWKLAPGPGSGQQASSSNQRSSRACRPYAGRAGRRGGDTLRRPQRRHGTGDSTGQAIGRHMPGRLLRLHRLDPCRQTA